MPNELTAFNIKPGLRFQSGAVTYTVTEVHDKIAVCSREKRGKTEVIPIPFKSILKSKDSIKILQEG
jgi:hypothetical protein